MKTAKIPYWIKQRYNPQLGTIWYKAGQLTVKRAKEMEKAIYGDNFMHRFATEEEYLKRIDELIKDGAVVR